MDQPHPGLHKISPEDQRVLDLLVESGFDPTSLFHEGGLIEDHRTRAEKLIGLLDLLEHLPTHDDHHAHDHPTLMADLTQRTLQHIEKNAASTNPHAWPERDHDLAPLGSWAGLQLRELVALAAIVLVGLCLFLPLLSHAQHTAGRIACQANLATAGSGLAGYAADHMGILPATLARPGDPWWEQGKFDSDGFAQSNSAHLFVAVRSGHVRLENLRCGKDDSHLLEAGDLRDWPADQRCSFSYQNQHGEKKARWTGEPEIAVLADQNPLFEPGEYHQGLSPDAASPNHKSLAGQNVLTNSGSVTWLTKPLLGMHDNIWQLKGKLDSYQGTEVPTEPGDSFLTP